MSITETTYFGLTRIREQGPEAKDWASVDRNPEIIARLLRAFQNHAHTGTTATRYPGYRFAAITNYVSNPSFETSTTAWASTVSGLITNASSTLTRVTTQQWIGTASMSVAITGTTGTRGAWIPVGSFASGQTVTASVYVRPTTTQTIFIGMQDSALGNGPVSASASCPANQWTRLSVTWTPTALSANSALYVYMPAGAAAQTFYIDGAMVTLGTTLYDYFDGGTPTGNSWTGTANITTSTSPIGSNDILPLLTEVSTGGTLSPGVTLGVRLSYVDGNGLETDACSEKILAFSPATSRPLTPILSSTAVLGAALPGGTYVYALTKRKATGETMMSDVLPVSIPYDNTYSVTLTFDPISTYTDGTTSLNLYRSTGLSSQFQLVATITTVGQTSFTDTNTIAPGNQNVQPPTSNTFDSSRKLRIDWSNIPNPVAAQRLRVFVTNQAGLWSTDHLLTEIDLTVANNTYIDYLGSETLSSGWPLNSSQIPSTPPKVNLTTEASGGLNATADSNFNGFKAISMVLGNTSMSTNGGIWYDNSTNLVKAYVNSAAVTLSPPQVYKNWTPNPSGEVNATYWTATGGTPTVTRVTTTPYSGTGAIRGTFTGLTNTSIGTLFANEASTTVGAGLVPVVSGDWVFIRAVARAATIAPAAALAIGYIMYDAAGSSTGNGLAGGAGSVALSTATPVVGTWYSLFGWVQISGATTIKVVPTIRIQNNTGSTQTMTLEVDNVMIVKVPDSVTAPPYFDGDTAGAQWQGTIHGSPSLSGYFAHGAEEAGGHKAANITYGGTNVAAVLTRFTDTAGAPKQVQTLVSAVPTTSNPITSSTTYTTIPELDIINTTTFANQVEDVSFYGAFSLALPTGATSATISIILEMGGFTQAETELTQTATISGQVLTFSPTFKIANLVSGTHTVRILWAVSSGATATGIGTRRALRVVSLI